MAKEICISTTPHETRLAILEDDQLAEVYYERENEYTLAGSIYKGRVTRVLPGMQSSFVDVGLERDAFLYVTDFLEEQPDGEEYETSSAGGGRRDQPAAEGRRERGGNTERGGSGERSGDEEPARESRRGDGRRRERSQQAAAPAQPAASIAAPGAERGAASGAEPTTARDSEELTEGTRRWRGRRGRRRGAARSAEPAAPPEAALPDTVAAPFALPEHGAPGGVLGSLPAAGFAEDALSNDSDADRCEQNEPLELQASAAPVASPRTPAATLPGEALAKYGQTPAAPQAPSATVPARPQTGAPVNYTPPRPASQVEVAGGWDGGAVLPGESISRYKGPSQPAPVAERYDTAVVEAVPAAVSEPEQEASVEDPAQPGPAGQPESRQVEPEQVEPGQLEASQVEAGQPSEESLAAVSPDAEPGLAAENTLAQPGDSAHERPEEHGAAGEYEPEDGASAGQATPPHTSELRLSQLFGFGESHEEEKPQEPAVHDSIATGMEPAGVTTPKEPTQATASSHAHVGESDAGPEARATSMAAAESEVFDSAIAPSFGERFADEPFADDSREAPMTGPVRLETGADDGFTAQVDQLHGFAPGGGYLEEEVIDEEEYDFDPIHAHAEESDLEELEEEHLEGLGEQEPRFVTGAATQEAAELAPDEDELPLAVSGLALEEIDEDEGEEDEDEEDEPAKGEEAPATGGAPRQAPGGDRKGRGNGRLGRGRRGNGGRQSAQTQDLPIISDLLKPGQEIMVQIAKEPIAKKGARITSHIALPGRFLVFMPTVSHVGVSRKIASDEERKRLKRILISEKGESSGGFIVRTAADGASEEELRADLRFLISLWNEIKSRGDAAKAPALIYHDLNLVERILRDQVSSNFSTIWVDTEQEYERIVRFLNRFQPALVRRVKLYTKETPLFEHFGITDEISKALKSKVWLKSGGSIVINQTEALVAIDINTGKYVGKTARLEDTIVKTNLDAIPEIVRQIRLRDLGGIIVIDFIDMDERRNRHKVLAALEEAMKVDRAPSKVLQFNDFGLVAITRKRVKQSLERTLSVTCEICSGTGMVKSPVTVCNEIYIELRKMQKHLDGKDVMLRVNPEVVKQLKGSGGRWISEYEEMLGKTIIIKSDPSLHPEQFDIH